MKKFDVVKKDKKETIIEYNCNRSVISTYKMLNTAFEHYRGQYPKEVFDKVWDTVDFLYKYVTDHSNNEYVDKDLEEFDVIIRATYKN